MFKQMREPEIGFKIGTLSDSDWPPLVLDDHAAVAAIGCLLNVYLPWI